MSRSAEPFSVNGVTMATPSIKKIPKTLIHKKVEFTNLEEPYAFTLQDKLIAALRDIPKALDRAEETNVDSSFKRVIGSYKIDQSILLGQVLLYEDGTDIMFLIENPETQELEIDNAPVEPDESGNKKEVLQGALYFAIFGNDLVVVQSQTVSFKSLETHLNWYLKDLTQQLPTENSILLINQPSETAEQAVRNGEFREFGIGSPIYQSDTEAHHFAGTDSISTKFGGSIENLKRILRELWSDDLNLGDDLDDANVELFVQLRYKRTTSEKGQQFLDQLARASRHFDPEDTVIKTKSGKTIRGDELRLSTKRSIQSANGVLVRNDVYAELISWITELNEQGYIG